MQNRINFKHQHRLRSPDYRSQAAVMLGRRLARSNLLIHALLLQQRLGSVGRLSAALEPMGSPFVIDLEFVGLHTRIVVPQRFNKPSIAGRTAIRDDQSIERPLLRTHAAKSNLYSHF